jgi:hypothetical protein
MISDMTANAFAMEAIAYLAAEMAVRGNYDIRLEAAAAKEWNTCRAWETVDNTFQIRGGRGYETERSLVARGEKPVGVERMFRDSRITKVFEGASEIMHLFIAREAVDKHLQVAGAMVDPESSMSKKLSALPKAAAFYAAWYPTRWLVRSSWRRYDTHGHLEYGALETHMRFIERSSRKLAREIFHGMIVYKAKLQHKQVFLFRLVDVAMELFAMACAIRRARTMQHHKHADAGKAIELADIFCKGARRKVDRIFHDLWHNDDDAKYRTALAVLDGRHTWLEQGILAEEDVAFPPSLLDAKAMSEHVAVK